MVRVGDKLPKFYLKDQDGKEYTRDDFEGQKMVLFFYIKDNTPG